MAAVGYADWGVLVVETDVDRAVIDTLMTWLPTYLAQAERERNLPNHLLARPGEGSYQNALVDNVFPDGSLPAVVVTTARTDGDPEPHVDGYGAAFRVNVSVVVRGRTPPETREVAAVFGGAVRRVLVQKQIDLEGELKWRGSEITAPEPASDTEGRWLAAGMNTFIVIVDEVLTGNGPTAPDDIYPWDPDPDPDAPYDPLVTVAPGGATTSVIPKPRS